MVPLLTRWLEKWVRHRDHAMCSHSPKVVHKPSGVKFAKGLVCRRGTWSGSTAWTHPGALTDGSVHVSRLASERRNSKGVDQ